MLAGNTHEAVTTAHGKLEERLMGIVLIPKQHQKLVELEGSLEEKLQLSSLT